MLAVTGEMDERITSVEETTVQCKENIKELKEHTLEMKELQLAQLNGTDIGTPNIRKLHSAIQGPPNQPKAFLFIIFILR